MVETVRLGTVFSTNAKAYQKWQRRKATPKGTSLTGAALEAAIVSIGEMFPGNVIRGTVPA